MNQFSMIAFFATLIPVLEIILIVVTIYALLLLIKVMQIYIRKNS